MSPTQRKYINMRINRRHVLLLILFLALLTLFLPIKLHYSFEATAMVYPIREWHLKRGQDDSYISELQNFKTNVLSHLKSYKFERGDISEINFNENLGSGEFMNSKDTIAYIHSYYIENEIAKLSNLKKVEEDALKMQVSGEKASLIEQANQRYDFALNEHDLAKKKFERQRKLFNDSIISPADFEVSESTNKLAEINVQIAYSELVALQTGAKQEEINYIQQRIDSYEREIELHETLKSQYYIVPPIGGILNYNTSGTGILSISDTSSYILKIPVKVMNIQYLQGIEGIKFSVPGYSEMLDASFIDLDETVNLLPDQQMVIAKALISGGKFKLYPGMAVHCKVICDEITLFQYLKRGINLRF